MLFMLITALFIAAGVTLWIVLEQYYVNRNHQRHTH